MTDQSVSSLVREARDHCAKALGHYHALLPATNTIKRLQPSGDPGCSSCARILGRDGKHPWFNDRRTSGSELCRNCEAWKRDENKGKGRLPPLGVLEMWRDGVRVTSTRADRAEADERWRAKRKKRKAG